MLVKLIISLFCVWGESMWFLCTGRRCHYLWNRGCVLSGVLPWILQDMEGWTHRSASAFPVSDQTHSSICFGMCLCLQGRVWWLLCCLPTALFSHGILKAFRFKINNMHNSSVYQTKKISPPKHVVSKIIAFPVFFFLVHSAIYFQLTVSVSLAHILKCRLVGGFHFSLKNVICWFWTGSPLSF